MLLLDKPKHRCEVTEGLAVWVPSCKLLFAHHMSSLRGRHMSPGD